jgi:hypothetical protein
MPNNENIQKLIDRIGELKYDPRVKKSDARRNEDRFNMARYFNDCGTPSCMAAHICDLKGLSMYQAAGRSDRIGAAFLGVDEYWAHSCLFAPETVFRGYGRISPAMAIRALRRLMIYGNKYNRFSPKDLWRD